MTAENSQNSNSKYSGADDDLMNKVIIFALIVGFTIVLMKMLFVPYFYLLGFLYMPVFLFGILGAFIVAIPFFLLTFLSKEKDIIEKLKSNIGKLTFAILFIMLSTMPQTTGFYEAVCEGATQDKMAWFKYCVTPKEISKYLPISTGMNLLMFANVPIVGALLARLAVIFGMISTPPKQQFKNALDIERYIKMQKTIYSHLKFYEKVNPIKFPLYKGAYRLLDSPRRWIFSKKLIDGFILRPRTALTENNAENEKEQVGELPPDPNDLIPTINPYLFKQEMLLQLGEVYTGVEQLSDLEVILFSIFIPRLKALDMRTDDKTADQTLEQYYKDVDELWTIVARQITAETKKTPFKIDTNINQNYVQKRREKLYECIDDPIFIKITQHHAFVRTILIETLLALRKLGVVQSSEFSWLLYFDRNLWALLNNVGRPSYFVEALAPCMHHELECRHGAKLTELDIDLLIASVSNDVNEYEYSPKLVQKWEQFLQTHDESLFFDDDFYSENEKTISQMYDNETRLRPLGTDEQGNPTSYDPNSVSYEQILPNTGDKNLDQQLIAEMKQRV